MYGICDHRDMPQQDKLLVKEPSEEGAFTVVLNAKKHCWPVRVRTLLWS